MTGSAGFDAVKTHQGRAYTGMAVGRGHAWDYVNAVWRERKAAPDRWAIEFEARKERQSRAPNGSGCEVGTQYHWLVVAHQFVRKVDANAYATFMFGDKWKVGHRRPSWSSWSTEYPGAVPAEELTQGFLLRSAGEMDGAGVMLRSVMR